MIAGALEVQLFADVARLSKDINDARNIVSRGTDAMVQSVEKLKHALEGLAVGFGVEKFAEFVGKALESAAAVNELSQRTGVATEQLSQLQYAAKVAGVPIGTLSEALIQLQKSMANASAGDQLKIAMFKQLGITQQDLAKSTDTVMLKMADAYAHARDGAGKTTVAMQVMRGVGEQLVPFLNQGAQAIRALMTEADQLGLTIGGDLAEKANRFEENLRKIEAQSKATAIYLGGQFVTNLSAAMQAFIDGAKEGDKFRGVIEAIRAALTGTDQQKSDQGIINLTDQLLKQQNDLDRLKRQGYSNDSMAVVQKQADIAATQGQIDTTMVYRQQLQGQEEAQKLAAEAARKAREDGAALEAQTKASLAAAQKEQEEYRNINDALEQRIALAQAQLTQGRPLTEAEKLEIQITSQMKNAKVGLTEAHKKELEARLKLAAQKLDDLADQQREAQNAIFYHREEEDAKQAAMDLDRQMTDEGLRVNQQLDDQARALKDVNEQIALEASLLGVTSEARATALEQLRIEQQRRAEIKKITDDSMLADKAGAVAKVEANAAIATAQASAKAALQEQIELTNRLNDLGHQLWDDLWSSGHDKLKKLGDDIKKFLIDELYRLVARKWIFDIVGNVTGGAAGGIASAAGSSIGGSILGSAGTSAAGSSVFGGVGSAFMAGYGGSGAGLGAGSAFASGGTASGAFGVGGGLGGASGAAELAGAGTDAAVSAAALEGGAAAGSVGAGATAALGAIPVYGWIALAAIAIFSALSKGGGPKTEAGFGAGVSNRGDTAAAQSATQALAATYKQAADALGVKDTLDNISFFYAKDPQGTAKTQLEIQGGSYARSALYGGQFENVGRSDAEFQQAVALASAQLIVKNLQEAASGKIGDYLKSFDIASSSLDTLNQALQVSTDVGAFDKALESLGDSFRSLRDMSVDATEAFIKSAGGLQNVLAQLSDYRANFYSDAERRTATATSIAGVLDAAGSGLTADQILRMTRAQFRALVESTDSSSPLYTALLSVEGAFAGITPVAEDAASSLIGYAADLRKVRDSLLISAQSSPLSLAGRTGRAQSVFDGTLSSALAGNATALQDLGGAGKDYLDAVRASAHNGQEYLAAFAHVQAALSIAAASADSMGGLQSPEMADLVPGVNVGASTGSLDPAARGQASSELVDEIRSLRADIKSTSEVTRSVAVEVLAKLKRWDSLGLPLGEDKYADQETT